MKQLLKNYASTMFFILGLYLFYSHTAYYLDFFHGTYSLDFAPWVHFTIRQAFQTVISLYAIFLPLFYTIHTSPSKALLIIEAIIKKVQKWRYVFSQEEKVAMLAWCVKWFYAPLMIFWLLGHIFWLVSSIDIFLKTSSHGIPFMELFNGSIFWISFNTILFIDVFFFTTWYLLESPYLKNTIRSVEPTLLWWAVTLMCYPPFNEYTRKVLDWYSNDFPQFTDPYIHIWLNVLILILMGIYSWASLSLGFKASNLTNRGIVYQWPYKYIRHPAYVAKNTAWWIGGIPIIWQALQTGDTKLLLFALISLIGWSSIYCLRALTEEWHLSKDKDYREYIKTVPYRFIPWVI
jgi:Isoprenylcysteine carboxyl methyltransferase (ICMT) family